MKKYIFLGLIASGIHNASFAQTIIAGNISTTPKDPGAALEVQKAGISKLNIRSNHYIDSSWLKFSNRNASELGSDFNIVAAQEIGLFFNVTSDIPEWSNDSVLTLLRTGRVGIGTRNPVAKLHVVGNVRIADGTQGEGKTFTAESNGNASWQGAMAFSAKGTAPAISNFQLITTGSLTKITVINVEENDEGNMYNPATARATVPIDGWYSIDASITYSLAEAGLYTFHLQKLTPAGISLGTVRRVVHQVAPGLNDQDIQLNISTNLYLLAGQSLELFTEQNSGVQQRITGSFFTWFNMHRIR